MRYIVSDQGPIDRRQPGEDVTFVYTDHVLERLIEEGYVEAVEDEPETPEPPMEP